MRHPLVPCEKLNIRPKQFYVVQGVILLDTQIIYYYINNLPGFFNGERTIASYRTNDYTTLKLLNDVLLTLGCPGDLGLHQPA